MTKHEHKDLVDRLNQKLKNEYGLFSGSEEPMYRISWSEDQFEWRQGVVYKFDDHGNKIGEAEGIQYLPKYRQWLPHMWVLERCCDSRSELKNSELTTAYSFEPLYPFRDNFNNSLPPDWDICWLMIMSVNIRIGGPVKVYKDPDLDPEAYRARIDKLTAELFGNETQIGTSLSHKEGITVPRSIN